MTDFIEAVAILIAGLSIVAGIFALFGWAVATLISFIFGISFGFWKGVAVVMLCGILFGSRSGEKS